MTRTIRRFTGAMGALALAATGTFAFIATEENGANPDLAPLFAHATRAKLSAKASTELIDKAVGLYREGGIAIAEDRYKAAAILSKSEKLEDIHLSHDLSLAALYDGFLPAQKVVRAAQRKLLIKIGLEETELPEAGPYVPLERPTFSRPQSETAPHVLAKPGLPDVATTSMVVPIRPNY